MKVYVTGIKGFVGRHLKPYFEKCGATVIGVDIDDFDLADKAALKKSLDEHRPDAIVHLAAVSSVGQSWQKPAECFLNNTGIFLNLVECIRELGLKTRILSVGSSEEYGPCPADEMPLKEDRPLNPDSPYAVARVSQELLSKLYSQSLGVEVIMTRSFNHIGPGQRPQFVVASFVKQLVEASRQGGNALLKVGNIEVIRDFSDVRDVVRAYWDILTKGKPGEAYNVCSGKGTRLSDLIQIIATELKLNVTTKVDPALVRPVDAPAVIGSHDKITNELGWEPQIPLNQTIRDMIAALQ